MTESELRMLPLNEIFEFKLYNGKVLYGYPEQKSNDWYIVKRHRSDEKVEFDKHRVLPEQIYSYKVIDYNSRQRNIQEPVTIYGQPIFETLVIIGAGASYDYSFSQTIERPPLANNLFDDKYAELIDKFPGVESLCSQILTTEDVELYFQKQWKKVVDSFNPMLLKKLNDVQFYLHYLFEGLSKSIDYRKNNYIGFFQSLRDKLIEKGSQHRALVISFNYDTILESSLYRTFGYTYSDIKDYIKYDNRKFVVIKPHGSSNWIKKFKNEYCAEFMNHNIAMSSLNKYFYDHDYTIPDIHQKLESEIEILNNFTWDYYYYPQLLIPFRTKDEFVLPPANFSFLEYALSSVRQIIIIGWKGTEEKFKALLQENLGNKTVDIIYITCKDVTVENELRPIFNSDSTFSCFAPNSNSKSTFSELNSFVQEHPDALFRV